MEQSEISYPNQDSIKTGEHIDLELQAYDIAIEITMRLNRGENIIIIIPRSTYSKVNLLPASVLANLAGMSLDPNSGGAGLDVNSLVYTLSFDHKNLVIHAPFDDGEPRTITSKELTETEAVPLYITDTGMPADINYVRCALPNLEVRVRNIYPPKPLEREYPNEPPTKLYPEHLKDSLYQLPY